MSYYGYGYSIHPATLIGYEGGFPHYANGGGKKSAAELAAGVASAEHIPVPVGKVQAAKDAVVLLVNGQPVESLQRDGLTYWPVQLIDGAAADSFEVVMEAPTLLYHTNAEARARKEQQISDANKRIADAQATLAELRQALTRSEAAFKAAVETAADPDGNAELSDIGAMAIEQQRITAEIAKQQTTLQSQYTLLQQAQSLDADSQLTSHRITPQFKLQSGLTHMPAAVTNAQDAWDRPTQPVQTEQVVQVVRKTQLHALQAPQFTHAADQ